MVTFSDTIALPDSIVRLTKKYEQLNQQLSAFAPSLNRAMAYYNEKEVIKRRGELQRMYAKRKNLLEQIHSMLTTFVTAVLIVGKYSTLRLENLAVSSRGTKGALARAIVSMPSEERLYYRGVKLAQFLERRKIAVELIKNDGRSKFHFGCDGKLARDRINWDIAPCNRCGKDVNTHRNATFQLREVDVDHLKKVVPVRIPVPVVN